jgi:hypothetical protein
VQDRKVPSSKAISAGLGYFIIQDYGLQQRKLLLNILEVNHLTLIESRKNCSNEV